MRVDKLEPERVRIPGSDKLSESQYVRVKRLLKQYHMAGCKSYTINVYRKRSNRPQLRASHTALDIQADKKRTRNKLIIGPLMQ